MEISPISDFSKHVYMEVGFEKKLVICLYGTGSRAT